MNQVLTSWEALDARRKLVVAGALLASVLAMMAIWRLASQEDMSLLYAGLEPAAAGEVISALEQRAIPFEVRGNAIYVAAGARDETRLALAGEGLPANGAVGYELLDTMTGFGTTAQMFDAAYWRAKEGELARTILASREVRAARVHIASPSRQPFARRAPVTASVTVTPAGAALSARQAEAIRFLVASAIAELDPADVAVIDTANGVIPAGARVSAAPDIDANDREAALKASLERLLEARVGPGRALVEVHIDADMETQTITERVIDPTSRVAISTDITERSEDASGTAGGAVTVASNLPDGDAAQDGGSSTSAVSETRERQNFEISETRRERVVQPGQIRRISVAVMVDGLSTIDADGTRSWTPRPETEMTALRELVESAIGFDPARGDRVTLQSLEFPVPAEVGTEAPDALLSGLSGGVLRLVQTGILALVALLLGLFVVRPLLARPPALPAPDALDGDLELMEGTADAIDQAEQDKIGDVDVHKIQNLKSVIEARSDDSAEVLRRWIEARDPSEGAT